MRLIKRNIGYLLCFAACWLAQPSLSAQLDWRTQPYQHVSINEDLIQLLESFASEQGFAIIVSDNVKLREVQRINASFKSSAEAFLDKISNLYSLIWFYDGQALYFYSTEEQVSEFIDTESKKAARAQATMIKMGIWDNRYRWMMLDEESLLHVHGPPAYVNIIKHLIERFDSVERAKAPLLELNMQDEYILRVFSLQYARAADHYFDDGQDNHLVEGVVTKLRRMFHAKGVLDDPVNPSGIKRQDALIERMHTLIEQQENISPAELQSMMQKNTSSELTKQSYVEADEMTNSVMVYDRVSIMPLYERLIKQMDIAVSQVQIEVSIIEISTDRLGELGFEWQLNGSRGSLKLNDFRQFGQVSQGANWLYKKPGDFSTIFTGDVSTLMARVHALSESGEGQVISQPTVLTMNNRQALIDNSESFYVELEGQEEVDLREIKAGSTLKVTPRLVQESPGLRRVHLSVIIEDGIITDRNIGDLPIIKNSFINTTTYIKEDASLLIGGYFFDYIKKTESKVPLLGDIPIAGALFKQQNEQRRKMARMFLITPTVIDHLEQDEAHYGSVKQMIDEYKEFRNNEVISPNMRIFN